MTFPSQDTSRRQFIKTGAVVAAGAALSTNSLLANHNPAEPWFKISLAQWSLNRAFFKRSERKLDNLEFAKVAREMGIESH